MKRGYPTVGDLRVAVEGRAAIFPSLLWRGLGGGDDDLAPLWLMEQLRRLGFAPIPAGFWWRRDIPASRARRLAGFVSALDKLYPDDDRC